jgi:hypothetical protein
MAVRRLQIEPAEQQVRVADVVAELAQQNPSRVFDEQAEVVTRTLAAKLVSRDWSGRPVIPALDAERLLWSLRRDREQEDRERQERTREAELARVGQLPAGTIGFERPGEEPVYAPGVDLHRIGLQGFTTSPGGD